ncbi:MAG: AbrB/MazE/SpoVT family DNA-binding domain-containing protein [Planctomycetes bacterium]|nr:AbrB/MazE/SpoVT family DNA-binding domain-containing protein [Planctomycetota bacterium]
MKANLVRVGNSRGIRIPKTILDQCGLEGTVELQVRRNGLLIRAVRRKPRSGWAEAFRKMTRRGDDALLDKDSWPETRWAREEWKW